MRGNMPDWTINQIVTVVTEGLNYKVWKDPKGKYHIKGPMGELTGARIECRERGILSLYNEREERIFRSSWIIKELTFLGERAE